MSDTRDVREAKDLAWKAFCEAPTRRDLGRSKVDAAVEAALEWQSKQAQVPEGIMEIVKAVAHIGIDWGFGVYEIEQHHIDNARKIYEDTSAEPEPATSAVPEGWRLVPVDPTLGMLAALAWAGDEDLALGHAEINREIISNYGAMLAAAPQPTEPDNQ